jgi:uncharacterized membrane protein YqjE
VFVIGVVAGILLLLSLVLLVVILLSRQKKQRQETETLSVLNQLCYVKGMKAVYESQLEEELTADERHRWATEIRQLDEKIASLEQKLRRQ